VALQHLVAAVRLAITYGLMGVINMAHGELMMIGAYATYVPGPVQTYYVRLFDWYLLPRCRWRSWRRPDRCGPGAQCDACTAARWNAHLGHQPDAAAAAAPSSAQNVGVENPVDELLAAWCRTCRCYHGSSSLCLPLPCCWGGWLDQQNALGPVCARRDANRPSPFMGVNTARIDTYAFQTGLALRGWPAARSTEGNVGLTWARATSWTPSWWWCWAGR
jgi:hypothetical protein